MPTNTALTASASEAHCTLNPTPNSLERFAYVPTRVIVLKPVGVELLTFSVKVLVEVVGFVENDAVTPLGKPETLRVTF